MKLSKEELSAKINELELDDAKKIELMEDIADSMNIDTSELEAKIQDLQTRLDDVTGKYKERFLNSEVKEDTEEKEDEELEEKEVIDIKEI